MINDDVIRALLDEGELRALWKRHLKTANIIQTWDEWKDKVERAYILLIRRASEVPYEEIVIPYGELGERIGLHPLSEWFHLKIGHIVGACSINEYQHGRPLISALVVNGDTYQPGKGFWGLPGIPPNLRKAGAIEDVTSFKLDEERDRFWTDHLKAIDRYWKGKEH